jgi:hypothetical protein
LKRSFTYLHVMILHCILLMRQQNILAYHIQSPVMHNTSSYYILNYRSWCQLINGTCIFTHIMLSGNTRILLNSRLILYHILWMKSTPPSCTHWNTHCAYHSGFDTNLLNTSIWLVIIGTCSSLCTHFTCLEDASDKIWSSVHFGAYIYQYSILSKQSQPCNIVITSNLHRITDLTLPPNYLSL